MLSSDARVKEVLQSAKIFEEFEREKFYPGPGLEPGPLAFRANALPTEPLRTSMDA